MSLKLGDQCGGEDRKSTCGTDARCQPDNQMVCVQVSEEAALNDLRFCKCKLKVDQDCYARDDVCMSGHCSRTTNKCHIPECAVDADCESKRCIANTCRRNDGTCQFGIPGDPDCGYIQHCAPDNKCKLNPSKCEAHFNFCTLHVDEDNMRWKPPTIGSFFDECGKCNSECADVKDGARVAACTGMIAAATGTGALAIGAAAIGGCAIGAEFCISPVIGAFTGTSAEIFEATATALRAEQGYVSFEETTAEVRRQLAQDNIRKFFVDPAKIWTRDA